MKAPIKDFKNKLYPDGNITQWFGENPKLYSERMGMIGHNGIDIVAPWGTPIFAVEGGLVADVKDTPDGYGKHLRILTDTGNEWTYGHASQNLVKIGDRVEEGQQIQLMGNTGFVVSGATPFWKYNPYAGCYDKETEVLTENGWKLFKNWKGERVATINRKTKKLEYQKPTGSIKIKQENIFTYGGNTFSIEMALSQKHNILYYSDSRNNFLHKKPLDEVKNKEIRVPLVAIWEGEEVKDFILPSVVKHNALCGSKDTGELRLPMDTFLKFLGWFFSDGTVLVKKNRYLISISQSYSNKKKWVDIEECLNGLPFKYWLNYGKRSRSVNFTLHNKQLALYLNQFGKRAEKILPDFIEKLSTRQINIFIDAFRLGDGYTTKSSSFELYPGLSKVMADQLQILLQKTGIHSVIKTKKTKIGSKIFTVSAHKTKRAVVKLGEIKKKKYNDYVYCLEVPNSTLYVRRNGKPLYSGNTHLHLGLRKFKFDRKGWSYNPQTPTINILNYDNGYKGSIDFDLSTAEPIDTPENAIILQKSFIEILKLYIGILKRL